MSTSVALYSVAGDVDAEKIVREMGYSVTKAVARMLESTSDQITADPQLMAAMLQGAMAGVSRRLLESRSPEKEVDAVRRELITLTCAYLKACSVGSAETNGVAMRAG